VLCGHGCRAAIVLRVPGVAAASMPGRSDGDNAEAAAGDNAEAAAGDSAGVLNNNELV
jgi:hypothetical protein